MLRADRRSRIAPGASALGAFAAGAFAGGAVAVGAMAIGRLAIGRLAIGGLTLGRGRGGTIVLDSLEVGKLTVAGQNWPASQ